MARQLVFIDLETSGLQAPTAEILEVGLAFDDGRDVSFKVKPEHIETADPKALAVNGYRAEDWVGAISQREAAVRIAAAINECLLAGQCTKFDVGFLEALSRQTGIEIKTRYALDLVTLTYEHLHPLGCPSLSMTPVCEFLGIPPEPKVHQAINGARMARKVFGILQRAGPLKRFWWWFRYKIRAKPTKKPA
jgi:DNA polymerase-3 subunit epsilon